MIDFKIKSRQTGEGDTNSSQCCNPPKPPSLRLIEERPSTPCCPERYDNPPEWIVGTLITKAGPVFRVSTELTSAEYWEHAKCRISAFRNSYMVKPGLYAVGEPDENSHVLVSANYKLSFDLLRKELSDINAWILVLDTNGINVWCAAGKGTFGTNELCKKIASSHLSRIVSHRKLIMPQLGAPGISAYKVKQATGFKALYGPVYAKDLASYITAGCKATEDMRRVNFTFLDRLVLTPMEINPAMKKYPLFALLILLIFGLHPTGIIFKDALSGGLPFLLLGLVSVISGALLTPVLLPFIPFRSFAIKGWICGTTAVLIFMNYLYPHNQFNSFLLGFTFIFFPVASSYIALQFTGSTTFTGMSGVKKELKIAIPVYISLSCVSITLLIINKLNQWGVL